MKIFVQDWKNRDAVARICVDNLEMQTALLKQTKEELLSIYRDSLMMFLSTTRMLDKLRNVVVMDPNVAELSDEELWTKYVCKHNELQL